MVELLIALESKMAFTLKQNRLVLVNVILGMNRVRPKINASCANMAPSAPKKVDPVIVVQDTACQMKQEPSAFFTTP